MAKSKIKFLESDGKTWSYCHSDPMICKRHNHVSSRNLAKIFKKDVFDIIDSDETEILSDDNDVVTYSDYLVRMAPVRGYKMFECHDCGINTLYCGEYYMVNDEVWQSVASFERILCIGCLEVRLNRKITHSDFTDAPLNHINMGYKSPRLIKRLTKV